jgi:hypothetical protein
LNLSRAIGLRGDLTEVRGIDIRAGRGEADSVGNVETFVLGRNFQRSVIPIIRRTLASCFPKLIAVA